VTTPPTNANPTLSLNLPGYDPTGNQVNVAINVSNITTDPDTGVVYGNLAMGSSSPGTGATNLGKAEDGTFTQGDVGVMALAVRNNNNATLTTADGHYSPINVDEYGRIRLAGSGVFIYDPASGLTISNSSGVCIAPYPFGATPITASSGNVANAAATATLAQVSGKTTYITGFAVSGTGANVGLPVIVTVTNVITGTMSYIYAAVAGVLLENTPLIVQFPYPIPANAAATTIPVSCPALGTGNTNNTVNAYGFQL
jgi:hypothetical protein